MQLLRNIPWNGDHKTMDTSDLEVNGPLSKVSNGFVQNSPHVYYTDELFKLLCEVQFWNEENGTFVFSLKREEYSSLVNVSL